MHINGVLKSAFGLIFCGVATFSQAADLMVNGQGRSPITADIAVTRQSSLQAAKRDAVLAAIKKINGPSAADDPKVIGVLDAITQQIGDEFIFDQSTSRDAANNFVTVLKLKLDDKDFRKLVSDQGIALKTANNYPILVVMDEYFTAPTDGQKPLSEVVEMFSDKSSHLKQSDASSDAANSSSSSSANSSASVSGQRSASASYYDGGYAAANGQASIDAHGQQHSSQSDTASSNSSSAHSVDEGQNDIQSYKKVVQYQPQNVGPSEQSYTYEAILREAASYDLNMIDNSLFRSKYFTGKPLTLQELTNGSDLARYVAAAHDDAKADFFMAGTSIIYDRGKDAATGQSVCDGVVTLKAYATTDGKILATDARTESASGNSSDQCRVNVANKLAVFTGSVLGSQISEYWKNRNMYGRQYTIQMVSLLGQLNFQTKHNFGKLMNDLKGVKDLPVKRGDDAKQVEYSVQYNGETPIGDAIGELVSNSPAFKAYPNFDVNTKGDKIRICLEAACPAN